MYIDLDSSYRDRSRNPNPSEFSVQFGSSRIQSSEINAVDAYSEASPITTSSFTVNSTSSVVGISSVLPSTTVIKQEYINSFLYNETRSVFSKITKISGNSITGLSQPLNPIALTSDSYTIRRELPISVGVTSGVGNTTTLVKLDALSPVADDFYKGWFVRILNPAVAPFVWEIRRIIHYNPATNVVEIDKALSFVPLVGFQYEMLKTSDNYNPINHVISTLQQEVCYTIQVLHVTIPNASLNSGYGGVPGDYPYFYLRFSNPSNSCATNISSNNPSISSTSFKLVFCENGNSKFTELKSGMMQILKFKPYDTFNFSIHFPNGDLLTYDTSDSLSPFGINPSMQISATFYIKKMC